MPKVTKVISGTQPGDSLTTVYTVPTGKVARIEILLGFGIRTSDGSISFYEYKSEIDIGLNVRAVYAYSGRPEDVVPPCPDNYTIATTNYENSKWSIVRNVTYLKAGGFVQVPSGKYSILVVEEDAG